MNTLCRLFSSVPLISAAVLLFLITSCTLCCAAEAAGISVDSVAAAGRLSPALAGQLAGRGEVDALVVFKADDVRQVARQRRIEAGLQTNDESILAEKRRGYDSRKSSALSRLNLNDYSIQADYENLPIVHLRINEKGLDRLLNMGEVASVQENGVAHMSLTQSLPLIHAPETHSGGYSGGGTSVAVLDTGVNYTLADFGSCTAPGVPASCRVAYVEDFAPEDGSLDDNGHGTNVSAVVAGVAPDTEIIGLDVFDGDLAYYSDILAAIDWVIGYRAAYNIVAVNLSLGGSTKYSGECPANTLAVAIGDLKSAGITSAVASGNENFIDGLSAPACAPDGISVGAVYDADVGGPWSYTSGCTDPTTAADQVTCFSNSAAFLKMLAPGALTTAAGLTMAGTSQAAPHVAGAVAVLKESQPGLTVDEVITRLTGTGVLVTDHRNALVTPRLNLYDAVFSDPLIGITPAGLSFSGIRNGTLPPDQSLTIRNDGNGTMNWSAGDDRSWLDLAPPGGIDDGSVSVSVDTTGLAVGSYSGTITITSPDAGNSPRTVPVSLSVLDDDYADDFESGDLTHLPWETSGDAFWNVQGATVFGGSYSAESGMIGDGQISRLKVILNVTQSGYVYFQLKTSSEPQWDKLMFRVDNHSSYGKWDGWYGETDWTGVQSALAVEPGVHVFTWDYEKDGSGGSAGDNKVWLDDIVFPPFNLDIQDIAIAPTAYDFGNLATGDRSAPRTFSVSNTGSNDLILGTLSLSGADASQFSIASDTCSGRTLVPAAGCLVDVVFSPAGSGAKSAQLTMPSNDPDTAILAAPLAGTGLTPFTLTVIKAGSGDGTVTSTPVGIDCGVVCSETYLEGEIVTLSSVAEGDSFFAGWSGGGCSGTGNCVVTIAAVTDVTATFSSYPPVAGFSGSPLSGNAPLIVNFSDASTNSPASWLWDFGDTGTAILQNPAHVYQEAGLYTVSLTATNAGGADTDIKVDYINVDSCPNLPVRVGGAYYSTLQSGYDGALEGEVIEPHITDFAEDLVFDRDVAVTVAYGYNCEYSAQAPGTTLTGSLTISAGSLVVDELVIQ